MPAGRVETVLDRFSHGQVVGTTEHSTRAQVEFTDEQGVQILDIRFFPAKFRSITPLRIVLSVCCSRGRG